MRMRLLETCYFSYFLDTRDIKLANSKQILNISRASFNCTIQNYPFMYIVGLQFLYKTPFADLLAAKANYR